MIRSALGYLVSAIAGAVVGLAWAVSSPVQLADSSWDVSSLSRAMIAVPAGIVLSVLFDAVTRRIARQMAARPVPEPAASHGGRRSTALATAGAAATVVVCGPLALLLIAALARDDNAYRPERFTATSTVAMVIAAIAALPLGIRIGRAIRHTPSSAPHYS